MENNHRSETNSVLQAEWRQLLPPLLKTPLCQQVLHFRGLPMAKERSVDWCVDEELCSD